MRVAVFVAELSHGPDLSSSVPRWGGGLVGKFAWLEEKKRREHRVGNNQLKSSDKMQHGQHQGYRLHARQWGFIEPLLKPTAMG